MAGARVSVTRVAVAGARVIRAAVLAGGARTGFFAAARFAVTLTSGKVCGWLAVCASKDEDKATLATIAAAPPDRRAGMIETPDLLLTGGKAARLTVKLPEVLVSDRIAVGNK